MSAVPVAWPSLPADQGIVYRHRDVDGVLLYVGSTSRTQFRRRHLAHVTSSRWWRFVANVDVVAVVPSRRAALGVERAAIRAGSPVFNRVSNELDQESLESRYLAAHRDVPAQPPMSRRLSPRERGATMRSLLAAVGVDSLMVGFRAGAPSPRPGDLVTRAGIG